MGSSIGVKVVGVNITVTEAQKAWLNQQKRSEFNLSELVRVLLDEWMAKKD